MLKVALTSCAILCAPATLANPMDEIVSVEVIPGWATQSGSQMAALRISLAPGWKTYWRAPGDAGIPPLINFAGSENVVATRMQWPVPDVFYERGMRSIGYYGDVVIPVELTPTAAGVPMTLSGEMQIGVCEEICVPAHLTFSADILPGGPRSPAIVAALIDRPLTADEAGVSAVTCSFSPTDNGVLIEANVAVPSTGRDEAVVIEAGDPAIWVSEPQTERRGGQISAAALMVHAGGESFALNRSEIRITVLGSDHAVDVRGCAPG